MGRKHLLLEGEGVAGQPFSNWCIGSSIINEQPGLFGGEFQGGPYALIGFSLRHIPGDVQDFDLAVGSDPADEMNPSGCER